jgi:hypothetical protein
VRLFFDDLSDVLYDYRYRPAANFVGNAQQAYHSLGIFGNGTLYIDQPDKEKGLRYKNIFLGECVLRREPRRHRRHALSHLPTDERQISSATASAPR